MVITYFITCTTHGSWLHGDERGSYKRGGQFLVPDCELRQKTASHLKSSPFYLRGDMQQIVVEAFRDLATERAWTIYQLAICETHFHILLDVQNVEGRTVRRLLKSKATMRLRQRGLIERNCVPWTEFGNVWVVDSAEGFRNVSRYINEHNEREIVRLKKYGEYPETESEM